MGKPCTACDSTLHTAFTCPNKPRKTLHAKRRMKKVGKVTKRWIEVREQWFSEHEADSYSCYLRISPFCPKVMPRSETTLDHIKGRGRCPQLRYELSNLAPCCWPCNELKGSREIEEL